MPHQNQARLAERHGPKFKMTPQEAPQPQTGAQVISAKEVFVAERGVLSNGYTVGIQLRARQNPRVETLDLHLPSKRSFQMRNKVHMHAVGPRQKRHADLQGDDYEYNRQRRFPPLLQLVHVARKFRRLIRKKVGASLHSGHKRGSRNPFAGHRANPSVPCEAYGPISCELASARPSRKCPRVWTRRYSPRCSRCSSLPRTNKLGKAAP